MAGNYFQPNQRNCIYKAIDIKLEMVGFFLTGIPDAEAFVACGVVKGPVQVDFVNGAGDA